MPKILIVDDSQFMRSILKTILEQGGYLELVEASNGLEAIDKVTSEHPDLVMMDIIMPQMDGMKTLENVGRAVKVIMVTAVGQEDMVEKAISLGAKDYIVKPFNAKHVLDVVKKVLTT